MYLSSPKALRVKQITTAVAMWVATAAAPCAAQMVTLDADAKLVLSDNPFLLAGSDKAAGAVEIVARPELVWPVAPATSLELSAVLAHRQYFRRYGGFLTGSTQLLANHRDSEFLSLDARFLFARTLAADALTESIDFSVDPRSVRESYSSRLSLDWTPSAVSTINTRIGWEKLRYPDSALLSPTTAFSAGLGWTRRLSASTSLGVLASSIHSDSAGPDQLSTRSLRGTLAYRLGPRWQANAQLGVEWTSAEAAGANQSPRLSGSGNLCYRPARLEACLNASLQSEVSGLNGLQRELFLGATVRQQLDERGSIAGGVEYRSADLGPLAGTTDAVRVSASYERRLTRSLLFRSSLDYLRRQFLTGERNRAFVLQIGIVLRRRGS